VYDVYNGHDYSFNVFFMFNIDDKKPYISDDNTWFDEL
jgi:hypothetical protein